MTSTSPEIVARLVKALRRKQERHSDLSGISWREDTDCQNAAYTLEALMKERDEYKQVAETVDTLTRENKALEAVVDMYRSERDATRADYMLESNQHDATVAELKATKTDNTGLQAALQEIADVLKKHSFLAFERAKGTPRRANKPINPNVGFATAGAEARFVVDTDAGVYNDAVKYKPVETVAPLTDNLKDMSLIELHRLLAQEDRPPFKRRDAILKTIADKVKANVIPVRKEIAVKSTAFQIAVLMTVHAATGTTTVTKAKEIESLILEMLSRINTTIVTPSS